mmetsp:Transcript_55071/g.103232  ORF Transcript_55071/g.103232 Transcript_55071/m.103232 type:complete len:234 (-) Transcript_55071:281-982(-)
MFYTSVVHRVDLGDILPRDDLGEGPAEGPIGPCEVHTAVKLINLVEDDHELVIQTGHGPREHVQGLARCPRPVRIKEEEDKVSPLGKPTNHFQEVVPSPASHGLGLHWHVNHARRIHDLKSIGHVAVLWQLQLLPSEVAPEWLAETLKLLERPVLWATQQRWPIFNLIPCRMTLEHCEAVICGCHASFLHACAQESVDESGLSCRVVSHNKHHGRERESQQVVLERLSWKASI